MTTIRGALRHRATVERNAPVSDGGGGYIDSWAVIATGVPCRGWLKSALLAPVGDKPTVVNTRHIAVPLTTDVRVGDRMTVRNRTATRTIFDKAIVDGIGSRADHLHLTARTVA